MSEREEIGHAVLLNRIAEALERIAANSDAAEERTRGLIKEYEEQREVLARAPRGVQQCDTVLFKRGSEVSQ